MFLFQELKKECLQGPEVAQEYEKAKQFTPEEFKLKMEELAKITIPVDDRDSFKVAMEKLEAIEEDHRQADTLMCSILTELGYGEVVAIFEKMMKYYI